MESCKRWSFVYIEFIEVINVMLCGIYRDRMIRIIKRSLYRVKLCKKWYKIFIWKNVCITRKTKTIKTKIYDRMEKYLIDIVSIYTECFVLTFLDIAYCFYWCKVYETVLGKSRKKLGAVLLLIFSCSHRRRLLLQSMQNSGNRRLGVD